jgi:hypothetical protein
MAAVTGTIVALGGLGVSVAQAIGQNKSMKKAEAASLQASKELKAINEQNAFKQLQVPTLGTQFAQESQAQRETQTMNMLQGAGAEGVIGGVGQLVVAGEEGDFKNAVRLDELKYERDAMQAQAQQGINSRKQQRDFEIGFGEKSDAEYRRAQAEANRNAAIESAFGFAGSALTSASKLADLYKNKQNALKSLPGLNYNRPLTESQTAAGGYGDQYFDPNFGSGQGPLAPPNYYNQNP